VNRFAIPRLLDRTPDGAGEAGVEVVKELHSLAGYVNVNPFAPVTTAKEIVKIIRLTANPAV